MSLWKFAAVLTGLFAAAVVAHELAHRISAIALDDDHRYAIDDLMDSENYAS